jgi:transcriptional regulator with XRE-family HTH domain
MPYECLTFVGSESDGRRGGLQAVPIHSPMYGGRASSGDDMKINRSQVLALRKQRSWSQDELAVAAGLNLRTVQRIERGGSASLQSRKALAAVFNIDVSDLESPEESMATQYEYRVVRFDMKWNTIGSKLVTDFAAVEKEMNVLGAEGWELVKISEVLSGSVYTVAIIAFLKRAAR